MGICGSYDRPAEVPSIYYDEFIQTLPRMSGKIVAITGCTSGTGYICAKACAQLGARVVMLNRPSSRADEALKTLKAEVPGSDVRLVACDLMSFASVRRAGQQLLQELGQSGLDVLCNNAGIMGVKDEASEDGCDVQMQTNHLSHFLLTSIVWPLLERAVAVRGEARVVNHSSGARDRGGEGKKPLDAKYLQKNGANLGGDATGCSPFSGARWTRYQQSKLANLVFTYALRDKLRAVNSKVKSLVCHPGLSATNLQVTSAADGGMGQGFTNCIMKHLAHSGEDGSVPLIRCCCHASVTSGDFYGPKGITGPCVLLDPVPEEAFADEPSRKMLWDTSLTTTGAKFPF